MLVRDKFKNTLSGFKAIVIIILAFQVTNTYSLTQDKKSSENKGKVKQEKATSSEAKLTPVEAPTFDEKQILTNRKERVISQELLNQYEAIYPGYSKLIEIKDKEKHTYIDKNDIQVIFKLKEMYAIKDSYVEELNAQLAAYKESKLSPEEKKLRQMKKEEEERQKAAMPVVPSISNE